MKKILQVALVVLMFTACTGSPPETGHKELSLEVDAGSLDPFYLDCLADPGKCMGTISSACEGSPACDMLWSDFVKQFDGSINLPNSNEVWTRTCTTCRDNGGFGAVQCQKCCLHISGGNWAVTDYCATFSLGAHVNTNACRLGADGHSDGLTCETEVLCLGGFCGSTGNW